MAILQTPPYLQPSPDRIRIKDWQIQENGNFVSLKDSLDGWDPATSLQFLVSTEVDITSVLEDCRLSSDARLRLATVWSSPGTGLRGRGDVIDLQAGASPWSGVIGLHITGTVLSGFINIETQLVLMHAGSSNFNLSPRNPGSLLWRSGRTIQLEGQESRFPTELIDFSASSGWLPAEAAWYLEWDPHDLHQLALGNMRLLVNASHKLVRSAVTESRPSDEIIKNAIYYDTGRTMIMRALENDDFVENPNSYAEESIGAAIRRLLQILFNVEPSNFKGLQLTCQQDPSRFECRLQERLKLFQEI